MTASTPLVNRDRRWTIFVGLIVIAAALIPRLLTYDRYLPFSDYTDESVYIALADEMRGFSDQTALRASYGLLAPLYVIVNAIVQTVHDALSPSPWRLHVEYYYSLRLVAVVFGALTALTIAWTAGMIAGRRAALIAGLAWALSPIVVDLNSLAIPDPPLYFVAILAVAAAIRAWQRGSFGWLLLSLLCGAAALYLKLWPVIAFVPFGLVSILLLLRDRRRWLRRVGILYALTALIAVHFLVVLNPFANTLKISSSFDGGLLANLLSVDRQLNNLWHLHYPISGGSGWLVAPILIGGGLAWYALRRRVDPIPVVILAAYTLIAWLFTAVISRVNIDEDGRMRHLFPTVVAFIPLWAAALVTVTRALGARWTRLRPLTVIVPLLAIGWIVVGSLPGLIDLVRQYQRTHTVALAQAWFDGSPPRDGTALMVEHSRASDLWNRIWGAYGGSKPFDYLIEPPDVIATTPLDAQRARGVTWFVVGDRPLRAGTPPGWDAWIDALLPVRTFTPDEITTTGETIAVYRLEPIDHSADALFGGSLRLVGYDLRDAAGLPPGDAVPAGATLALRPYWRLAGPAPAQPLSLFVHLYRRADLAAGAPAVLAQVDTEPLHNTHRPPLTWADPAELYFGNPIAFGLPADLEPGAYALALGLYDYTTGQRLLLPDGVTSFFLIDLTIRGAAE
ncbi:MAG: ArnT family glycosyltransferase [Candidatus Flexifilum sp.]